jgi:hypothetical protein
MPAQAAPQRQGLLGGFFGPEGRDARARLAIGLEGLTMNPNQALIGQLQQGIEDRKIEGERNRTLEWLSTLNTPEAQRALQYAQATGDIVGAAKMVLTPATQERGVVVGNDIVDRITGNVIYKGPEREELTPAAFVALDLQARAAGFEPGTPVAQDWRQKRVRLARFAAKLLRLRQLTWPPQTQLCN